MQNLQQQLFTVNPGMTGSQTKAAMGAQQPQMSFAKQPRFATVAAPGAPTTGVNFGGVPIRAAPA